MKIRLLAALLLFWHAGTAQTVVNTLPKTLVRPANRQQLMLAPADRALYLLAADKEKALIVQYNSALFFRDSLSVDRPDRKYDQLMGYSTAENVVTSYWATEDLSKWMGLRTDFSDKKELRFLHEFNFNKETFLSSFSREGIFYVLTADDYKPLLRFYRFENAAATVHEINLSSVPLKDRNEKAIQLNELLLATGLAKMDPKLPNTGASTTAPVKMYDTAQGFLLTFDLNPQTTTLVEIDDVNFAHSQKQVNYPELENAMRQASFWHENRLYQIKVSEERLLLTSTDLITGQSIATHQATSDAPIPFKNSPLMAQTNDNGPYTLNSTDKFLARLSGSSVGISVYRTPEDLLLTIGGMRNVTTAGDVFLGIAAGTTMVLGGGYIDPGDSSQFIFFDALFDDQFAHKALEQDPLAMDKLSSFIESEEPDLISAPEFFDQTVLLALYDSRKKELVLRRFRDGRGE